ncbi:DUF3465 domain-containing protein [Marinicellulosiphila megalodicopiae]|uniref:DUF3465 domain-containing protein n=1 Tax=Marinicellulosiphila megalodicopiae TaxID=2724896 RepID=UPI003BB0F983
MKHIFIIIYCLLALSCAEQISESDQILMNAFEGKKSDFQIEGKGRVKVSLPDDTTGSQHQKFILELQSKQTLLIAHNIDIAQKIHALEVGDTIEFYGEYEWNDKGGVIHWTHIDPNGNHIDGWLKHDDIIYQ